MFWQPIWWYSHAEQAWSLPRGATAAQLASARGPGSFLAAVVGNKYSAAAVGDSGGFEEWLANVLARPERLVPIL
eukprot:1470348-Prymnesium_polylepis.1